jgi:hypothetical protein
VRAANGEFMKEAKGRYDEVIFRERIQTEEGVPNFRATLMVFSDVL